MHFRQNIVSMELIPGTGGAFEVTVNGQKIYSKLEVGEFPDYAKLIESMESMNT